MRLTKYEHACFVVEYQGRSIVVDPGEYTSDFVTPENVIAVAITHEHQDHLSEDHLRDIQAKNPDVIIIGHADVVAKLTDFDTRAAGPGDNTTIGPFELDFFGGTHAVIHTDIPVIANLGVMINDTLYYPGDSFTLPGRPVNMLALPVSAPWMKISEAVDFVRQVRPKRIFPTHDAVLSDAGKGLPDRLIPRLTAETGTKYERLHRPLDL